jgi:hypothetical protein
MWIYAIVKNLNDETKLNAFTSLGRVYSAAMVLPEAALCEWIVWFVRDTQRNPHEICIMISNMHISNSLGI